MPFSKLIIILLSILQLSHYKAEFVLRQVKSTVNGAIYGKFDNYYVKILKNNNIENHQLSIKSKSVHEKCVKYLGPFCEIRQLKICR